MKPKYYVAILIVVAALITGCMTPYGTKLEDLAHQRSTGQLSEADYQAELKKLRDEQPWGASDQQISTFHMRGTVP